MLCLKSTYPKNRFHQEWVLQQYILELHKCGKGFVYDVE
jgi:hypothetical protein